MWFVIGRSIGYPVTMAYLVMLSQPRDDLQRHTKTHHSVFSSKIGLFGRSGEVGGREQIRRRRGGLRMD